MNKHFIKRFRQRVMKETQVSKDFCRRILRHCLEVKTNSRYGSESVCVYEFEKNEIPDNENQLWVVIRYGILTTTFRRSDKHTHCTNEWGMNVDNVRYDFV